MHAILLEHRAHRVVAAYLALVGGILQVARFDVFPDLLYGLRARELGLVQEGGEGGGEGERFLGSVRRL